MIGLSKNGGMNCRIFNNLEKNIDTNPKKNEKKTNDNELFFSFFLNETAYLPGVCVHVLEQTTYFRRQDFNKFCVF